MIIIIQIEREKMESVRQKELIAFAPQTQLENLPKEQSSEQIRPYPPMERKVSKRREVQQERVIVMELFKELVAKINEGYSKVIAIPPSKVPQTRPPKISKPRPKPKQKQVQSREIKEVKARKASMEQTRIRSQRKQEIWANYSVLMNYQIVPEDIQLHVQPLIVEQPQ